MIDDLGVFVVSLLVTTAFLLVAILMYFVAKKTLWDLLQLLIVPLALAGIGFWFTAQQETRQQQIEEERANSAQKIEEQRAQDEALQAYLDQMSALLLDRDLRDSEEGSEVRTLAQARTLVVLDGLGSSDRKRRVLRFLYEMGLTQSQTPNAPIIRLNQADFRDFESPTLRLLEGAVLTQATLSGAELPKANLEGTNLSGARLNGANLRGANLRNAKLCSAWLNDDTDLSGAVLVGADFGDCQGFWRRGARMSGADLSRADLTNAEVTKEQLKQAGSLQGATMPNGQKYEDWLKDKEGSGEDGKNSNFL